MNKNARILPKMAALSIAAAFALCGALLAGCGSTGSEDAEDAAADTSQAEPEAPAAETYTGQVEYGGIKFDVPEGWTAIVTNSALTMEIPDGGASDASVQGTVTRGAATEGDEQASVDTYIDSILETLSQQEGFEEADYSASIEGVPSKTVKCSLSANDMTVEVYVVAVAVDGNITNLIMASSEGEYDAEYQSIIDSMALA